MPLVPFQAGQSLTAADLNAAFDIRRVAWQTGDQIVNNSTTFVSSTFLTLTVAANSSYVYEALLVWDTNSTADFKHQLLVPAGAAVRQGTWTPTNTVAATNTTIAVDALDAIGYGGGGVALGTMLTARPVGLIATVGTAGSVTVQFAQGTANASNTTLKTGSWIRLTKVA